MWKVLKSRHPVSDAFLSLRADTCELASGCTLDPYYVFEFPAWVNVLALTTGGDALLVRQYRHGLRETLLELPCGVVDEGETREAAVTRELLEETGHVPSVLRLLGSVSPNPANHTNLTHCFLATGCSKVADPIGDPSELLEVTTLPLADLMSLASSGGLRQALHVACLFLALGPLGVSIALPEQPGAAV